MPAHRTPRQRLAALSSVAACGACALRGALDNAPTGAFCAGGVSRGPSTTRSPARPLRQAAQARPADGGAPAARLALAAGLTAASARAIRGLARRAEKKDAEVAEAEPFFEEVQGDDPIVLELEERLRKMNGNDELTLDMVLSPGAIVNTERKVILLRAELKATPEEDTEKRKELEDKIEEGQMKIVNEMRQVMTDSLKAEFILQALLNVLLCGALCYGLLNDYLPDLSSLGLNRAGVELTGKLYGIWGIWLLTVPALRARKPGGPYGMGYEEKRALDLSFLVLPFVCIFTPFFSRDPAVTFWASCVALGGLYAWSFSSPLEETGAGGRRGAANDLNLPEPVQWALKALDFGTGEERGARREDTTWQDQLAQYEAEAERLAAERKGKAAAQEKQKA